MILCHVGFTILSEKFSQKFPYYKDKAFRIQNKKNGGYLDQGVKKNLVIILYFFIKNENKDTHYKHII